ncbi:MAG: class I SAM-dependent methyltransferase [Candidatus Eisenbacteria bacterium]|jgi:SAM-dependent methyltransferase|nr:class I SAM-dependent methyltransferase [Candidatus Eisenbacteria bacterium]
MTEQEDWDAIYHQKAADRVSWYRPHLERSLAFIQGAHLEARAAIIDVGGGASTLVDDLLDRGFTDLTVLDISMTAIAGAKRRLGPRAAKVSWVVADITQIELQEHCLDFWHDRAVFHFLCETGARRRYVEAVRRALKPGGHIVVATFGPHGPKQCSGFEVTRYSPDELHGEFGSPFEKVESCEEMHLTPWGSEQEFVYCHCRMVG